MGASVDPRPDRDSLSNVAIVLDSPVLLDLECGIFVFPQLSHSQNITDNPVVTAIKGLFAILPSPAATPKGTGEAPGRNSARIFCINEFLIGEFSFADDDGGPPLTSVADGCGKRTGGRHSGRN
jgi:hypothetical protein